MQELFSFHLVWQFWYLKQKKKKKAPSLSPHCAKSKERKIKENYKMNKDQTCQMKNASSNRY